MIDPKDLLAGAENALLLAKALSGMAVISDEGFLQRMATSDKHVEHDGTTCGQCHSIILGATVAREMLAAGGYVEDVIGTWAAETRRRWDESKFVMLWKVERAAGRDPNDAFKARGWEP